MQMANWVVGARIVFAVDLGLVELLFDDVLHVRLGNRLELVERVANGARQ